MFSCERLLVLQDIDDGVHPGNWNGSLGYRSTGKCLSSHNDNGTTSGEPFGTGDIFGVMITYFGKRWSTALFLKNGIPVSTCFIFENDPNNLLPTIGLENGPIELGLMWPESVLSFPKYSEKHLWQWIKPKNVVYSAEDKVFSTLTKPTGDTAVQCPIPLSSEITHFEVIVLETSDEGKGPVISIEACSPMYPQPTCSLLNDFFRWVPDGVRMKSHVGQRLGWGIHYSPVLRTTHNFDDKAEQLVVCFVTIDFNVVHAKMIIQPEGGFYPVVLLYSFATKVRVDVESRNSEVMRKYLDELYQKLLVEATTELHTDLQFRNIKVTDLKMSPAFDVTISENFISAILPKDQKGIHVIQFKKPLTKDAPYFAVEIKRKGDSSVVSLGIAGSDFPLNRYPGRLQNTVGYHSKDGKMYHNDKFNGNMCGQKFEKGDCVGVEVDFFGKDLSVVLFRRNQRPVGTRFHSQPDHSQFCPTIAVFGNGSDVELNIVYQNRMSPPSVFQVANIDHWCVGDRAVVDQANNIIHVDPYRTEVDAVQAAYSLDRCYNHFEVEFIDDFDDLTPPPAIALCTASPLESTSNSNFRQDFLRFWAIGEARKTVKKGDLIGWGQIYPHASVNADQLLICYLTINRDIVLTRVMYEPPGGFYPVVLLPVGVNRVKLNFGATIITEHPLTQDVIDQLIKEAQQLIFLEKQRLRQGTEPEEWDSEENKAKYLKPVPITAANLHKFKQFKDKLTSEQLGRLRRRPSKVDNFVDLMLENMETKKRNKQCSGDGNDDSDISRLLSQISIDSKSNSDVSLQNVRGNATFESHVGEDNQSMLQQGTSHTDTNHTNNLEDSTSAVKNNKHVQLVSDATGENIPRRQCNGEIENDPTSKIVKSRTCCIL